MGSKNPRLARKYDLFIFDWDGTLNSLRLYLMLNERAKKALGLWNAESTLKDFKSMGAALKRKTERKEERKNSATSVLTDMFLSFSKPKLHKNSIEMLQQLRKRGKRLAIFSNARARRLTGELSYVGIMDYFDLVVSARAIHAMKPSPAGIRAISHALGVKRGSTLYVGDAVEDMLTAQAAGVAACAVADGFDSYRKLKSTKPDYIFTSIGDLTRALW